MSYNNNNLDELRAEMKSKQNQYYFALRNYGESYDRYDEQNATRAHERLERVYQEFLEAKQNYLKALDQFIESHPMTEYTSL